MNMEWMFYYLAGAATIIVVIFVIVVLINTRQGEQEPIDKALREYWRVSTNQQADQIKVLEEICAKIK